MAVSKSQKIQAEIDKVKAKISEQQARLKELEQKKLEAENSEIVDIVRGMSIPLAELPLLFLLLYLTNIQMMIDVYKRQVPGGDRPGRGARGPVLSDPAGVSAR